MDDEFLNKLPESIQTIVRLTDVGTALTLVNQYGGTNLHFPAVKMINANHELAALIGFNNLRQLCQYWGGETIYLPHVNSYAKYLRQEKILRDSKILGTAATARKYGISNRWVRELKRQRKSGVKIENKKDDRQLDMFN